MRRQSPLQPIALYSAALFCLLLVGLGASPISFAKSNNDWRYSETHSDVREFAPGGSLHVRLNVGDVHIKQGDSSKIRLEYTVKSERERTVKETTFDFDVHGNDANIEFHVPSMNNTEVDVELEIPASTNLDVHTKVGDIHIDGIEGDKDLNLGVGDIRVSDSHSGYRRVDASTGIGDVNSAGYGETSGWLGKTLKYHGDGKYELRAHVGVGDINLEGNK
jgi:hypothetical protein